MTADAPETVDQEKLLSDFKTRLKAYGVGESQKISDKDNINRRVEFKVVN